MVSSGAERYITVTAVYDTKLNEVIFLNETWYHHSTCEKLVQLWSTEFWLFLGASLICICFAGIMSGLTVGLMGFDPKNLSILMQTSKNPKERKQAARVFSLVSQHHQLLVTLLLWNAAAFESLPIFLDKLAPTYVAILLSVTFILMFGEVIPQAVCTGPKRLAIGARSYYLVKMLMYSIYPLAWPIAKGLDLLLGTAAHTGAHPATFLYVPEDMLRSSGVAVDVDRDAGGKRRVALLELHGMCDEVLVPPPPARGSSDDRAALLPSENSSIASDV